MTYLNMVLTFYRPVSWRAFFRSLITTGISVPPQHYNQETPTLYFYVLDYSVYDEYKGNEEQEKEW